MAIVSIVIPIYNVELYLEQCLDAVIHQTFDDIEIICVLDGPTDQSGELAKKYAARDTRISIIEQPNSGVSVARNVGLNKARGEYIIFIDGDDWIAPEYIERLYDTVHSTGAGMAICNYNYVTGEGDFTPNASLPDEVFDSGEICRQLILDKVFRNFTWNKMIKKQILDEHHIQFPQGILFQDMAIISQVAYHSGKVAVINEYLYYYRSRTGSSMTTYNPKRFEDLFRSLAKVKEFLVREDIYEIYQVEYEYACASHLMGSAVMISKGIHELIPLLPKIKDYFYGLLDGRRRILPEARKMMSAHRRLAMRILEINHHMFVTMVVWKWI